MSHFGDFWVTSGFILLILSTILCVVYGAIKWNQDGDGADILAKEEQWEKEEKEIEDKL